jgi:hypothetical protein
MKRSEIRDPHSETKPRIPLRSMLATGAAVLVAACQGTPKDYAELHSRQSPGAVAAHISENVGDCWFSGARPAFSELIYAPELNSFSGKPRVLIVPKAEPHGLPRLVIEASAAKRGTSVKLFGPLMASAEAPAIARDVERWAGGRTGCA